MNHYVYIISTFSKYIGRKLMILSSAPKASWWLYQNTTLKMIEHDYPLKYQQLQNSLGWNGLFNAWQKPWKAII